MRMENGDAIDWFVYLAPKCRLDVLRQNVLSVLWLGRCIICTQGQNSVDKIIDDEGNTGAFSNSTASL